MPEPLTTRRSWVRAPQRPLTHSLTHSLTHVNVARHRRESGGTWVRVGVDDRAAHPALARARLESSHAIEPHFVIGCTLRTTLTRASPGPRLFRPYEGQANMLG